MLGLEWIRAGEGRSAALGFHRGFYALFGMHALQSTVVATTRLFTGSGVRCMERPPEAPETRLAAPPGDDQGRASASTRLRSPAEAGRKLGAPRAHTAESRCSLVKSGPSKQSSYHPLFLPEAVTGCFLPGRGLALWMRIRTPQP